jgi:DNA segregation ATPase FtsK/SpoIIIE, S-DNA-T family
MSFETFVRIMRVVLGAMVRTLWWCLRHPRTFAVGLVAYWLTFTIGPVPVAMIAALIGAILWAWSIKHHESFERMAGRPLRTHWRRVTRYELGWNTRMRMMGLVRHVDRRFAVPRLRRLVAAEGIDHLVISLPPGLTPTDVDEASDQLAHTYGARHCRVRMRGPSAVQLDFVFADRLAEIIEPAPLTAHPDLEYLEIGMTEEGWPWCIKLVGSHILVAGVTGSGKGSVVWSIIRRVAPAIRDRTVDVWAIDPKGGMELAPGRALFARFAADEFEQMAELLEDAVTLMRARATRLAGHVRVHHPTRDEPLVVILIDEVANLTAYLPDRKLRERITQSLAVLLTQGRAVGVSVVAALQDPRKEVISLRNLFPTKIALRLDERAQVDMVLGDAARELGADADRISEGTPGVGYVRTDGIREPVRVRASWISDAEIRRIAAMYARDDEEWTGISRAA